MGKTYNSVNLPGSSSGAGTAKLFTTFGVFPTGTKDGELAIAEDTQILYYWDIGGTTWIPVAAAAVGSGQYKPEPIITLSGTDITNKYIVLSEAPTDKNKTRLTVVSGIPQEYAVDFQVTSDNANRRLSWDALGLESILSVGDKLLIVYN